MLKKIGFLKQAVGNFTNVFGPEKFSGLSRNGPRNQVADHRFSLKQWFAGGAQSRGLRKRGFKVFA